MAFVSTITYPTAIALTTPSAGKVKVVADYSDMDRIAQFSIAFYHVDGHVMQVVTLADVAPVVDTETGWFMFDLSVPLADPGQGGRAIALIDAIATGGVASFYALASPLTALDGPAVGHVATALTPPIGDSIVFDAHGHRLDTAWDVDAVPICLTAGTLIDTPDGARLIDDLRVGDLVTTWDGDARPVRMIHSRRIKGDDLRHNRKLWPVCIQAGAMGFGLPQRNLWVSPQHRMLYQSIRVPLLFGEDAVFIRAKSMAATFEQVYVDSGLSEITYVQLVFDRHEVIFAEGAATESFHPGEEVIATMSPDARAELFTLFPELRVGGHSHDAAFTTLRSWELMACVA
ncbi:Hint domain-containing protein [Loktanella sp. SALINAS62]|uniref:Hint domain-containing protein n=1 Tax=Loktanella sp. SALINAS62 TaxID=2706124 RepID=UPI001B8B850E|nr:Hint domain-containing protein [Loktanella sp. SALINAS62]MBS1301243.1 Hint domain-containing protein [Loktanella sp. SALINAS62]